LVWVLDICCLVWWFRYEQSIGNGMNIFFEIVAFEFSRQKSLSRVSL